MRIAQQCVVLLALGCAAAICMLAGSAFANWTTVIDHHPVAIGMPARETLDAPAPVEQRLRLHEQTSAPGSEPAVDLYGNEVTDAVAKYTLDPTGALDEEHAPPTGVPRLAAPKS